MHFRIAWAFFFCSVISAVSMTSNKSLFCIVDRSHHLQGPLLREQKVSIKEKVGGTPPSPHLQQPAAPSWWPYVGYCPSSSLCVSGTEGSSFHQITPYHNNIVVISFCSYTAPPILFTTTSFGNHREYLDEKKRNSHLQAPPWLINGWTSCFRKGIL